MNFLLEYEAGKQPLQRTKTYRKDIDVKCVDNVAHEIAKFHACHCNNGAVADLLEYIMNDYKD